MKEGKNHQPPWAMFSFIINAVRLVMTLIHRY